MNKKYWEKYYAGEQPTEFAKFCLKYIPRRSIIMDIGCGNGRDSYFFKANGHIVVGVDFAFEPQDTLDVTFVKEDLKYIIRRYVNWDIIYSRFFIHSITTKEIIKFVKWSKGLFMAEFRDKTDEPQLFKNHKRNLVDGEWFKKLLIENSFEILYYKKSQGLAKYRNEDPMIVRVIAKKCIPLIKKT